MSDELISRQAAIKDAESWVAVDEYEKHLQKQVIEWLKDFPPAEPKKGKWLYQKGMLKCDQCLRAIRRIDHDGILNFCPNCGADMRGEQDE